jgi:hypothetical protein
MESEQEMNLSMAIQEMEFEFLVENVRDALYDYELWLEETLIDYRQVVQMNPSTADVFHS